MCVSILPDGTERCRSLQTAFKVSTTVRRDIGEGDVDPAKQPQKYNGLQGTDQLPTGPWAAKSFPSSRWRGRSRDFASVSFGVCGDE